MEIKYQQQDNQTGDSSLATQGFGKVDPSKLVTFQKDQVDQAYEFFAENGYAVMERLFDDNRVRVLEQLL